MRGMIESDSCH